jgi:hypothetical protein
MWDRDILIFQGTFFGALAAAPFGDMLGRRMGLMVSVGVVFNLGVILQTISTSQPLFIAGRFFAGLGVGLISALSKSRSHFRTPLNAMLNNFSPHVPIRDSAKMDPRCDCRKLPARHYDRSVPGCHCQQRDGGP